jgi:hypothetical protein
LLEDEQLGAGDATASRTSAADVLRDPEFTALLLQARRKIARAWRMRRVKRSSYDKEQSLYALGDYTTARHVMLEF